MGRRRVGKQQRYSTQEADDGWGKYNRETGQVALDENGVPFDELPEDYHGEGHTMYNADGILVDVETGIPVRTEDQRR